MNYKNHYNKLIIRAQHREIDGYCEKHHIIPKCLNGVDDLSNIVQLTPREHFIAHLLLIKIHPANVKLIFALNMMCCKSWSNNQRSQNRMYGWLREKFSKNMSTIQGGKNNSRYGTCWIFNESLEKSMSIPKSEIQQYIDDGWMKGRVLDFEKRKQSLLIKNTCSKCGAIVCKRPSVCAKPNMINTLATYFEFDKTTFGSFKFYDEYDRVVSNIKTEYEINKLSTLAIVKKYNITSTQRLDSIFRSIGIKARTPKEALTNFHKNNK